MPPGGDGFYYTSVYLPVYDDESALFGVQLNGRRICTAITDLTESPSTDAEITMCSGVGFAVEGIHEEIHENFNSTSHHCKHIYVVLCKPWSCR